MLTHHDNFLVVLVLVTKTIVRSVMSIHRRPVEATRADLVGVDQTRPSMSWADIHGVETNHTSTKSGQSKHRYIQISAKYCLLERGLN